MNLEGFAGGMMAPILLSVLPIVRSRHICGALVYIPPVFVTEPNALVGVKDLSEDAPLLLE